MCVSVCIAFVNRRCERRTDTKGVKATFSEGFAETLGTVLFSVNGFTEYAEAIFYFSEGFTKTMSTEVYFQFFSEWFTKI